MIGKNFYATGIILKCYGKDKWAAQIKFFDSGFCDDRSTEGELTTRYFIDIETAIDVIREDAEKMGIKISPVLMGYGDGEDEKWPMPENWKDILQEQAKRLKWIAD
jgi:hypothetical protein